MWNDVYDSGKKIHKAVEVFALEDYLLEIKYDDGKVVKFDVKTILNHPLFKSLKDIEFFKSVRTNGSSICWDNDIDICADSLYQ